MNVLSIPENIDGGQPVAHFVGVVAAIGHIAETELAAVVEPPALDGAIVE